MSLLNQLQNPSFMDFLTEVKVIQILFYHETQALTCINYNSDEIHNKDFESSKNAQLESINETKAVWLKQLTA